MKAGVVYPQIELGGDTGAVKAFAQAAEDLGYDHIVIYDHVLGAEHAGREPKLSGPYKETDPFHELLITYAHQKTRIGHRRDHPASAADGLVRKTGCGCRPILGWSASVGCRGRLELGGIRRPRNARSFPPPRSAPGASDRTDTQAVGEARGAP